MGAKGLDCSSQLPTAMKTHCNAITYALTRGRAAPSAMLSPQLPDPAQCVGCIVQPRHHAPSPRHTATRVHHRWCEWLPPHLRPLLLCQHRLVPCRYSHCPSNTGIMHRVRVAVCFDHKWCDLLTIAASLIVWYIAHQTLASRPESRLSGA